MTPAPTIPVDTYAAALRALGRASVGAPDEAPAFAQCLEHRINSIPAGTWIVTVLDYRTHRSFQVVEAADEIGLVELLTWADELCAECGEDLGEGAYVEDMRTATHRGTIGERYLAGCSCCLAHVERGRAA